MEPSQHLQRRKRRIGASGLALGTQVVETAALVAVTEEIDVAAPEGG